MGAHGPDTLGPGCCERGNEPSSPIIFCAARRQAAYLERLCPMQLTKLHNLRTKFGRELQYLQVRYGRELPYQQVRYGRERQYRQVRYGRQLQYRQARYGRKLHEAQLGEANKDRPTLIFLHRCRTLLALT